jgi:nucleoside-diphosphate-sugar epimerase
MGELIGIIGGSGFIGRHLIRDLLAEGYQVRNLDAQAPEHFPDLWVEADLRDLDSLKRGLEGCTAVVNLAAAHRDDVRPVSLYHDINVQGSQNVCDAAAALGINRILFTSSVAVYGLAGETDTSAPDETTPPKPFNPYGQTKWEAEAVYQNWVKADPAHQLIIVRPTVVFGPDNRGNVYNLIAQLAKGAFVMVGSGRNRKSMAYVENVSAFLTYLLQQPKAPGVSLFNYVDKPDFDMNTLVTTVRKTLGRGEKAPPRLPYAIGYMAGLGFDVLAKLSGKSFPISRVRVQKFCANTIFSSDKMQASGFTPPHDLPTALSRTITHEFGK